MEAINDGTEKESGWRGIFGKKPGEQSTIIFLLLLMTRKTRRKSVSDLTNRQLLKALLSQIAIFRFDLKNGLDNVWDAIGHLQGNIKSLHADVHVLKSDMKQVKSDLHQLHFKVDQNHLCLMTNQDLMEKRIEVLEAA